MDKVEMLQKLIDKSDDAQEIEKLKKEQLEEIARREHEKAKEEVKGEVENEYSEKLSEAEKAKEQAESKLDEIKRSMKEGTFAEISGDEKDVEVGEPDKYRGFNLNRAKAAFKEAAQKGDRKRATERIKENPEGFNHLVKTFTDLVADSYNQPVQKADLLEGTDSQGGYLVNDDDRDELLAYARDRSVALRRARVMRMNSDKVTMPREDGKVQLSFSNESTAIGEASATFDQVSLEAVDLDGYADVSLHLEQDASTPGGVVGVLLDQFVEAYGQKLDERVFNSGSVSTIFDLAGNTVTLGSTTFSSIDIGDLRSAVGKLKPNYRSGAAWFGEYSVIWDYMLGIKENSQSVLIPDYRNAAQMRALGYPVEEVIEAPNTDGTGKPMLVFGNLNGFLIGERLNNLTLFRDPYSQRINKRIRYSFFTRVATKMALPDNFVKIQTA